MAQEATGTDWSVQMALTIAAEVRRHRQAQGLSAQQLSDRCAEAGMPIQRSVLANLESGRRTTVTAAELLVLAHALRVPPGVLLFPVGIQDQAEVLPGVEIEPGLAVDWLSGRAFIDEAALDAFPQTPLGLFRLHQSQVLELQRRREDLRLTQARAVELAKAQTEGLEAVRRGAAELGRLVHAVSKLKGEAPSGWTEEEAAQAAAERGRLETRRIEARVNLQRLEYEEARARNTASYFRDVVKEATNSVASSEAELLKIRGEMKARGLSQPPLPEELLYVDPDALTWREEVLTAREDYAGDVVRIIVSRSSTEGEGGAGAPQVSAESIDRAVESIRKVLVKTLVTDS